jgi:hypothetical protein
MRVQVEVPVPVPMQVQVQVPMPVQVQVAEWAAAPGRATNHRAGLGLCRGEVAER